MKETWILAVMMLGQALVPAQSQTVQGEQEMHRLHQDSKAYIAMLEDPKRDEFQKPMEVVRALDLKEGEVIADVGAGSGYFTFRFAHHVGQTGRVFAVDVNPDMILYMNRRIRDLKLNNVTTILAAAADPFLADSSVDRFFFCEVWHHIENRQPYLALVKRMLKPGGQVIMVDFQKRELPVGPPMSMKIAREDLLREMEGAGFYLIKEHTFLPYQYFLVFGLNPK